MITDGRHVKIILAFVLTVLVIGLGMKAALRWVEARLNVFPPYLEYSIPDYWLCCCRNTWDAKKLRFVEILPNNQQQYKPTTLVSDHRSLSVLIGSKKELSALIILCVVFWIMQECVQIMLLPKHQLQNVLPNLMFLHQPLLKCLQHLLRRSVPHLRLFLLGFLLSFPLRFLRKYLNSLLRVMMMTMTTINH